MGETPPLVISEEEPVTPSSPASQKRATPVIPPRSPGLIKQQSVASGLVKPNQTSPSRTAGLGRGILNSKVPALRGTPVRSQSLGADPFDADWATPAAKVGQTPTNPFVRTQQTFQISM